MLYLLNKKIIPIYTKSLIPTYIYKKKLVLIACSPPPVFAYLHRLIQTLDNYKIVF